MSGSTNYLSTGYIDGPDTDPSTGNYIPYNWNTVGNWFVQGASPTGIPSAIDTAQIGVSSTSLGYEVAVETGGTDTVAGISFTYSNSAAPLAFVQDLVLEVIGNGTAGDASLDITGNVIGNTRNDGYVDIAGGGKLEVDGTSSRVAYMFGTYTNAYDGTTTTLAEGGDSNNNELIIGSASSTAFASPIYGLVGGNEIILSKISYAVSDTISVTAATGLTDGTHGVLNGAGFQLYTATIKNSGGTTLETLTLSAPSSAPLTGTDGTPFLLVSAGGELGVEGTAPVCFAAGTRILTAKGEIAVEQLAKGDEVITARGELRPISWIGRLHVNLASHAKPEAAQPIRIKANALADGMPHRDLIVSPDHAFLLDGLLIEAKHLVNGATIFQEARRAITYYHVELASHDVLLAEGAAAESYLESNNRETFDNAGNVTALHPVFETAVEGSCYPRQNAGPAVEAVRDRLRRRALGFGFAIRTDVSAWIEAEGRRLTPASTADGLVFTLDGATAPLRLRSGSGVPAELCADPNDRRVLGLSVLGLTFAQGETRIEMPLDSSLLAEGFYAAEHGKNGLYRWTNGNAVMLVPPSIDAAQPFTLTLRIAGAMQSWQPAIAA